MQLHRSLILASVAFAAPCIAISSSSVSAATVTSMAVTGAHPNASLRDSTPTRLLAEAPIKMIGQTDGNAFLAVTIQGHPATLIITLHRSGLSLEATALGRIGVTLTPTSLLDSLGIGTVMERQIPVRLVEKPQWMVPPPKDFPPVVGIVGGDFLARYDVEYNFSARRIRLYSIPAKSETANKGVSWLPPGFAPGDCDTLLPTPTGVGAYTAMKMKLNGRPVTGVLEMGLYYPKMNQAAVLAMELTEQSPTVEPIPAGVLPAGYTHNGHAVTHQVKNVEMTIGSRMFWSGSVQIFPSLDAESTLGAKTPIMLLNLAMMQKVVLFNSPSSHRVCISPAQ